MSVSRKKPPAGAALRLNYLAADKGFLEPDRAAAAAAAAAAVVIPYGLEASVSYGGGTAAGPAAILQASQQLELFDEELWRQPCRDFGVATLQPPEIPAKIEDALAQLAALTGTVLDAGRFPLVLGGEHSLTAGAIRPFAERYSDLVVLQFDAHADLRDGYLGAHYSHASAMRRVLDHPAVSLVAVGIRAISAGEIPFLEANRQRLHMHFAKDMADWELANMLAPLAGRHVYVTFDIDGLDAGIMPATGTPEPGGLSFWQACKILRRAGEISSIVGADVVELAPIAGLHACDFTAAKLAYKIMSYALCDAIGDKVPG